MGDYILGDYMSWWDPLNVLEDYMVWMSQSEMVNDLMRWLYGYGKTLLYIRRLYGMGEPIRNICIYYMGDYMAMVRPFCILGDYMVWVNQSETYAYINWKGPY